MHFANLVWDYKQIFAGKKKHCGAKIAICRASSLWGIRIKHHAESCLQCFHIKVEILLSKYMQCDITYLSELCYFFTHLQVQILRVFHGQRRFVE